VRASTDNIGIARHPEGLELVRIGKPLRPEFAAWRYGDQFGRRKMPEPTKLALEMALHEEQECRALEGELKNLETAWRAAEEIAGIPHAGLGAARTEFRGPGGRMFRPGR